MNPSSKRIPPECWPEVSDLFDQALALPSPERDAWLAEVTRSRPEAAAHLRGLLTMHGSDTPLTAPDGEVLAAALFARLRPLAAGTEIDIFRLIAPLGEGGLATVWSAEQQQGVRRRVAL